MYKILTLLLLLNFSAISQAQDNSQAKQFWDTLQSMCGKAYEGILELPTDDKQFGGKRLVMHILSCTDTEIRIPFFVGDDKSRTWVLTYKNDRISLKHDHRHKDGTEDKITQYGGTASNSGQKSIQIFPADAQTTAMIPVASTNVWWITLNETTFTYNLRRLGTPRVFRVVMDITKTIEDPRRPWGW